jgi:hypothetical protein
MLLATLSAVEASDLPNYQVTGDAFFNLSPPARRTLNGFGSIPLTDERFGSVSFAASGTPSPLLTASAQIGPSDIERIFGRGAGFLTYSFEILGPSGTVPVLIDVAGRATASASSGATFAVESRWDLLDTGITLAGDDKHSGEISGNFDEGFDRTVSLMLTTNHVYSVFMLADAAAAATALGSSATGNAFVDPTFSFGPGVDTLAYSFHFSEAIGNSRPVPEPGTVFIAGTGLLLLSLLRWRSCGIS